jgi:hypothetical protein
MSDSYATNAQMTPGGQIELTVQLDDFTPEETVELSGQATQTGGAFANFYDIVQVPKDSTTGPDGKEHYYVSVTTSPLPPHKFRKDQDVTVFLKAAKVWVTVLGAGAGPTPMSSPTLTTTAGPGNPAGVGDGWGKVKQVSDLDGEFKKW